jgi:hypothetical protein
VNDRVAAINDRMTAAAENELRPGIVIAPIGKYLGMILLA